MLGPNAVRHDGHVGDRYPEVLRAGAWHAAAYAHFEPVRAQVVPSGPAGSALSAGQEGLPDDGRADHSGGYIRRGGQHLPRPLMAEPDGVLRDSTGDISTRPGEQMDIRAADADVRNPDQHL